MTELEPTTALRLADDVRYRVVEGEAVIVRQSEGEVVVLNRVGARILELVAEGRAVASIVDTVLAEYDSDRATVDADVREHLSELISAGVVTPTSG
jgi:hypothetical protein